MDNRAIGIFDSGVGGLSAVKSILAGAPNESVIYFGDTARVPYGNRERGEITDFAVQDMNFLRIFDLKALLIACNTITVCSLDTLREKNPDVPIVGVVDAAVNAAVEVSKNGRIGVIATRATVRSGIYTEKIRALCPETTVFETACPKLVPLIESGHIAPEDPALREAVAEYCAPLKEKGTDTLILGCTHYPLIAEAIRRFMGADVTLVDSGGESVREILHVLGERGQLADAQARGKDRYFCSGSVEQFGRVAEMFLKKNVLPDTLQVDIEKF